MQNGLQYIATITNCLLVKYYQQLDSSANFVDNVKLERTKNMCYNCGCEMPNDDMGVGNAGFDPNGKSITDLTFEEAAKSQGMTKKQAQEETYKLLKKILKK